MHEFSSVNIVTNFIVNVTFGGTDQTSSKKKLYGNNLLHTNSTTYLIICTICYIIVAVFHITFAKQEKVKTCEKDE